MFLLKIAHEAFAHLAAQYQSCPGVRRTHERTDENSVFTCVGDPQYIDPSIPQL